MINRYLVVPLGLDDLNSSELLVLSQFAYLKRSYSTITASNDYISNKLGLSVSTVKRAIKTLIKTEYIISNFLTKDNKTKRTILLTDKALSIFGLDYKVIRSKKSMNPILKQFISTE